MIEGVRFVQIGALRPFFNRRGVRNGWADMLFTLNMLRLLGKLNTRELDVLDVCATPFIHLPLAAMVARIKRIPVVLTCHEALLASLRDYVRERGHSTRIIGELFLRLLIGIYCLGMELFPRKLAVSQRTATALEKESYAAAGTVAFGLEPEAFRTQAPEGRPETEPVRFIFCGRLTPIKSVDQAMLALLSLRAEGESFHFDIVGEGSERSRLEQRVRAEGAEEAVTFHGEVSESVKRSLLARSDVFLLSSPREGFSIATLEGMAQGCAALVVSDPQKPNGVLDFVSSGCEGLCVEPGLPAMREGLRCLLHNRARLLEFRSAAWMRSRQYRIEHQTGELLAFYRASGGAE